LGKEVQKLTQFHKKYYFLVKIGKKKTIWINNIIFLLWQWLKFQAFSRKNALFSWF